MISLTNEYTDGKSRHARGWLFFDAECEFCKRVARLLLPSMQRRNLAIAPLQDPRVSALLGLSREELLREVRYVRCDGVLFGGVDAFLELGREIGWLWPLVALAYLPGMRSLMEVVYRQVALQRSCPVVPTVQTSAQH